MSAKAGYNGTIAERLARNISPEPNSGCWLWTGSLSSNGYGQIHDEGRTKRTHRAMWCVANGEVPEGLDLDHKCRVRSCCNPDHLEPVTRSENLRRSPITGRQATTTHCKHGHEYTPSNTHITSQGWRDCRSCSREKMRRRRAIK